MNNGRSLRAQRGAITIFICMIMLIFITLMVVTAFAISRVNLQAVGNVQVREQGIAAAQAVIEQVIASSFTDDPPAAALIDFPVDVNADGVTDYLVNLPEPACVRATRANTATASSVTLPGMSAIDAWNTIWELDATATDAATGTSVRVLQGVRKLLSDAEKTLVCS